MTQHAPAHDETVRMPADGAGGRPQPDGGRPPVANAAEQQPAAAPAQVDDTRPVTRDWQLGAPEAATDGAPPAAEIPATPAQPAPADSTPAEEDWVTETIDTVDTEPAASSAEATGASAGGASATSSGTDTTYPDDATGPTAVLPLSPAASDGGGPRTPDEPPFDDDPPGGGGRRRWYRRRGVLVPLVVLTALALLYGVDLLVSSGGVVRNTVVAGVDIGGLSPTAARSTLEEDLAPRIAADRTAVAEDVQATVSPVAAGISLDVEDTVDRATEQPLNPWTRLVTLFADREVEPVLTVDETAMAAQINGIAEQVDRPATDATISIEGTTPTLVEPADGRELDRDGAVDALTDALVTGADPDQPIDFPVEVSPPHVDTDTAQQVLDETVTPGLAAPVEVVSEDGGTTAEVPVSAIAASLTFTPQESGELDVAIDPAALQAALGDALGAFGTPAEDARFEVSGDTVSVVPSVDGTGVDPARLAEQLLTVLPDPAPRSVTAELGPVPAELTTAEAEALGIREEISTFTTNYTSTASGTNMRTAAAAIDGTIVEPGETFSLNEATGPRTEAKGYVEAGVISGGEFSTSVGGGVSQLATTIFNAVFFAGLEDVHHKPHSYYISRYPPGREATVWYDSLDLKWRNDSEHGVLVDTAWEPGALTVTFYGTKRYEIDSLTSDRYDITSPALQEKPDDGDCVPSSGSDGFSVTVTRIFKDPESGAELEREQFRTRYAAQPVVRCIPVPAPAPASPSAATESPAAD